MHVSKRLGGLLNYGKYWAAGFAATFICGGLFKIAHKKNLIKYNILLVEGLYSTRYKYEIFINFHVRMF